MFVCSVSYTHLDVYKRQPRITATDEAITNAATVGAGTTNARNYFFQRNNPLNPKDDFDPTVTSSIPTTSNVQLFNDLVNCGNLNLPGYGTTLSAKSVSYTHLPPVNATPRWTGRRGLSWFFWTTIVRSAPAIGRNSRRPWPGPKWKSWEAPLSCVRKPAHGKRFFMRC